MEQVIAQGRQERLPPPRVDVQTAHGDSWFILSNLVIKDFKVRYRNMSLGVFWSLVNPLIMMGVLTFVFNVVYPGGRENFPLFMLVGLLPYNFFSLAWNTGTTSISDNSGLVKQVPFARELIPVSVVLGNLVHYVLQLGLLLIGVAVVVGVSWNWLWLPAIIALQILFVCGLTLLTSALDVYYRDVHYFVEASTIILFWLVPIFYGFDQVGPDYAWIYEINPVAAVVLVMRRILLYDIGPGVTLLKLAGVSCALLWIGYRAFSRREKDFSDYL